MNRQSIRVVLPHAWCPETLDLFVSSSMAMTRKVLPLGFSMRMISEEGLPPATIPVIFVVYFPHLSFDLPAEGFECGTI
jgi:hypothetical protein